MARDYRPWILPGIIVTLILSDLAYTHIQSLWPRPWPAVHLAAWVIIGWLLQQRNRWPDRVIAVSIAIIAGVGVAYPVLRFSLGLI